MRYGITKNDTVPISNRKPIRKVLRILKMEMSTSLKLQIKSINLTKVERTRNINTKVFKRAKRFGVFITELYLE